MKMEPFFKPILEQIALPEHLKTLVRETVAAENGEAVRTLAKSILSSFEGVEINWPCDQETFNRQCTTQQQRLELLIGKVLSEKCFVARHEQMMSVAKFRPVWVFTPVGDSRDPEDCSKCQAGQQAYRYDDPFWQSSPVFCGRVNCRCSIITATEAQAKRWGLDIKGKKPKVPAELGGTGIYNKPRIPTKQPDIPPAPQPEEPPKALNDMKIVGWTIAVITIVVILAFVL